MQLRIRNVGKIKQADIAIDGITVLTGDNDTGKSTVGKVLYSLFSTFHNAEDQVREEKKNTLVDTVYSSLINIPPANTAMRYYVSNLRRMTISEIIDASFASGRDGEIVFRNEIREHFFKDGRNENALDEICKRYNDVVSLTDKEVIEQIMDNQFQREFGTVSIMTMNAKELSMIQLSIKDQKILLNQPTFANNFVIDQYINLIKTIIYIDDPFIMDNIESRYNYDITDHRRSLLEMLTGNAKKTTAVSEILTQKRLQPVMQKLEQVCDGNLSRSEQGEYQYRSTSLEGSIPVKEVSTGIKSFLILKQLLLNGQLEENGIVVLDEPEVHLHPQWQIIFSEILVMLHQQYNIHFLITTHSIDFLSAVEYYSRKYAMTGKCHFYLMEKRRKENCTVARETSGYLDEAYAELSRPFLELTRKLENEYES